jgi:ribosomal-protein-alanine N-acetyltransferase
MMALVARLFGRAEPAIAPAAARDARAMAALHSASFNRGWSEGEFEHLLLDRKIVVDRASVGRSLVGFIVSRIAGDEAEILSIAVAGSRRGKGIARRLLDRNLRYRRAGFREVGRRAGYYRDAAEKTSAALVLRRDLA